MPTQPREWPNNARWARDHAAEELQRAVVMLKPLVLSERYDRSEILRRLATALEAIQTALRCLESVGAQTRPY